MSTPRLIIIAGIVVAIGAAILARRGGETNTNGNTNSSANRNSPLNATIAPTDANGNANTATKSNGTQNTNSASNVNASDGAVATTPTFTTELRPDAVTATSPAHRSRLKALPVELAVAFQRVVIGTPTVSVRRDGVEYAAGDAVTSSDQLTIRRGLLPAAPDGVYTVNYYACFADNDCATGYFQFSLE